MTLLRKVPIRLALERLCHVAVASFLAVYLKISIMVIAHLWMVNFRRKKITEGQSLVDDSYFSVQYWEDCQDAQLSNPASKDSGPAMKTG